jgi:hypothetical protein
MKTMIIVSTILGVAHLTEESERSYPICEAVRLCGLS